MEVKGTWLLNFVKVIRANKDKDFSQWLEPEDFEIIRERIMPSSWYPLKSFLRMGRAIFKGVAESNLDVTRLFGRLIMQSNLKIYKNLLVEGDPATSIDKFALLRKSFFGGIASFIEVIDKGENWTEYKLIMTDHKYMELDTADAFSYLLAGCVEQLAEQTGGKNAGSIVRRETDKYVTRITWS